MGDKSAIQWTDASWNAVTGCDRVSPGCVHCYAMTLAPRLQKMAVASDEARVRKGKPSTLLPTDPYMRDGDPKTSGPGFGLMMHPSKLDIPLNWTKPRRIFVNSMSDLYHPEVTDEFVDEMFAVMALAPQHQFQILTKRPERMRAYMETIFVSDDREAMVFNGPFMARFNRLKDAQAAWPGWPLPNVWMGTSVENARWRTRIDELRQTPAAHRFLSCEPLLGPLTDNIDDETYLRDDGAGLNLDETDQAAINADPVFQKTGQVGDLDLTGIDWVIIGGESGPGARVMRESWVRDIVASCRRQGAMPFVKQMGSVWSTKHLGNAGHAGEPEEWPEDLRVREMPAWG